MPLIPSLRAVDVAAGSAGPAPSSLSLPLSSPSDESLLTASRPPARSGGRAALHVRATPCAQPHVAIGRGSAGVWRQPSSRSSNHEHVRLRRCGRRLGRGQSRGAGAATQALLLQRLHFLHTHAQQAAKDVGNTHGSKRGPPRHRTTSARAVGCMQTPQRRGGEPAGTLQAAPAGAPLTANALATGLTTQLAAGTACTPASR